MENGKQISVFLENKPGRLANVLSALARQKVNVLALTVMDSHEHSVLRFVPDNHDRTRGVLKELSIPFADSEVCLVELKNQPGELAHICEQLGAEHINIEYAYCSSGGRNGKTVGVFKLGNAAKAGKILSSSNGVQRRKDSAPRPLRDKRAYQAPKAGRD
jgi:hypothetical protein